MEIYDFIFGQRLDDDGNFIRSIGSNCISLNDSIKSIKDIQTVVNKELTRIISMYPEENFPADLTELVNSMIEDVDESEFIQSIEAISYLGYEIYICKRNDIDMVDSDFDDNRAYIINTNEYISLGSISNRYGVGFVNKYEDTLPITINLCLFDKLINNDISLSDAISDVIDLNSWKEKYEILRANLSSEKIDASEIIRFFKNIGYKPIILIQ